MSATAADQAEQTAMPADDAVQTSAPGDDVEQPTITSDDVEITEAPAEKTDEAEQTEAPAEKTDEPEQTEAPAEPTEQATEAPAEPTEQATEEGAEPETEKLGDTTPMTSNSTVPKTHGQVFEAYLRTGDNLDISTTAFTNRSDGQFVPGFIKITVTDAGGTVRHDQFHAVNTAGAKASVFNLTGAAGIWKIDISSFKSNKTENTSNIVWDWIINPQTGSTTHSGRVWAAERTDTNGLSQYRAQQPNFDAGLVSTAEDVTAYFLSDTGVTYRGVYKGYQGFTSYIGADSLGLGTASCYPAYTSAYGASTSSATRNADGTGTQYRNASDCKDEVVYRTFFQEPDASMPNTAPSYRGNTWLHRTYVSPKFSGLSATVPGTTNYGNTTLRYNLQGQPGRVRIEIDTTGTGDFVSPIAYNDTGKIGANTFVWNGTGTARTKIVHFRVTIENTGEIHFLNADVELRRAGLEIEQLTGPGAGISSLHWDDRNINGNGGNSCATLSSDQVPSGASCFAPNPRTTNTLRSTGTNSSGGVHSWSSPNTSTTAGTWGNVRVIDDWTFIKDSATASAQLPAAPEPELKIDKKQVGSPVVSADGTRATITWQVQAGNVGGAMATSVRVADTLPDAAIDSTVQVISVSKGTFTNPFGQGWDWFIGDLAAGQTETLTFRAQVALSGQTETFENKVRIGASGLLMPPIGNLCQVNTTLNGDTDRCDLVRTTVKADPDLRINKVAVGSPVPSADGTRATITWDIQAGNVGGGTASNVRVNDQFPAEVIAGTIEVVQGPSQGSVADLLGEWTWSVGTLTQDQTETVRVRAQVAMSGETQTFTNKARVYATGFARPPYTPCQVNTTLVGDTDRCDEVSTTVQLPPDLRINKAQVGTPVVAADGQSATITWSIEAGNLGKGTASNVRVTENFPDGVVDGSVVVTQAPTRGTIATDPFNWNVGTLAPGQTATVRFRAQIQLSGETETFVNKARVQATGFPAPSWAPCQVNTTLAGDTDRCDEVPSTVTLTPNLKIDKSQVGNPIVSAGGTRATITWQVRTQNTGNGAASNVRVTENLPAGAIASTLKVTQAPTQGTVVANPFNWNVGTLAPGEVVTVRFSAQVALTGGTQSFTNSARVQATGFPAPPWTPCQVNTTLAGDNDRCDQVSTSVEQPDLRIDKRQVGTPVISANGTRATITWQIQAGNRGTGTANNVRVTDRFPDGVVASTIEVISGPSQGTIDASTSPWYWNVGTLAPDQTEVVRVRAQVVLTGGEETFVNTARITASGYSWPPVTPCQVNTSLAADTDRCDVVETAVQPPDLRINKVQVGQPVISADRETATITWNINAGNLGTGQGLNVRVTDRFPAGTILNTIEVVSGPSQGTVDSTGTWYWHVGTLAPGQTETVQVRAQVKLAAGEQVFVNTARIVSNGYTWPPLTPCQVNTNLVGDTDRCDVVETSVDLPQLGLSGTVYSDLDADGTQDAGEPGIESWDVTLVGVDYPGVNLATRTDADGYYEFEFRPPGKYLVTISDPETGYVLTQSWVSVDPSGKTTNVEQAVPVVDAWVPDVDFGIALATEDITVIKKDSDGADLAGARFSLVDAEGTELAMAADGAVHTLTDLPYGTYILVETQSPVGHNLLAEPVEFTLDADGITIVSGGGLVEIGSDSNLTLVVTDVLAAALPHTGGSGTSPLSLALGLLLVLLAGGVGFARTRERAM